MKTGLGSRVLSGFGVLVTAFLLVVPSIGAQQGGTVTGRVLDSQTGQPLAAVQVFISALDLGGLTQQNGRYLSPKRARGHPHTQRGPHRVPDDRGAGFGRWRSNRRAEFRYD